jgi:membrane protein
MKVKIKGLGTVLKRTFKGWNEDDPFRQSAVIAYYAIFSLPALLVLIINVVGFFFEKEAINGEISRQISGVMGEDTAETVEGIVAKAGEMDAGVISTIIAIVTIIFGATGVFIQLQKTLNQIWDVEQKPDQGFMIELRHRIFSFGLILSIGFLLLISLAVSSALAAFSHWLESYFPPAIAYLFYALEFVVSLSVISTMFLLMFKFLPDVKMPWKSLLTGAVLTGFLFILGKYGLSFYFGKAEPGSVYGAAGSLILLLLWVSYSSMIVFFGAEFTKQYAVYNGTHIEPTKIAQRKDSPDAQRHQDEKQKEPQNKSAFEEQPHNPEKKTVNHYESHGILHNGVPEYKIKAMKKIKSKRELDEEIARLESRAEIQRLVIKEKLRPARVVKEIIQKRKTIPRPSNKELAMEGFDFAINFLTDHVLFKNSKNETVKSLSVYLMRELAKNYVYGRSENWVDHMKELLNITQRGPQRENPPFTDMDDPVDEYYFNM